MNVEFATETEITAVAISKDNNFITNASYNKSDNTVSLWNHSIDSDTFQDNGYIKINLEGKAPIDDKIDLTTSKLIPSLNSRFVILSYLFKENDSSKVKAVFIVLQWEDDYTDSENDPVDKAITVLDEPMAEAKIVNMDSENDPVDKAKTVLDEPMDEAKIVFKVFKNGKKSEADILRKVKNKIEAEFSKIEDGFINSEFLADGVILAIKYKTTIQFVSIASGPWTLFKIDDYYLSNEYSSNQDVFNIDESKVALAFNPLKHESYVLLPWRGKKIVDMVRINVKYGKCVFNRISCISNISKIQSIVGKKVVMSSAGDLLAFENGPIVEKQTGLHITNIAEEHVSSNKKDFTFMNDDRHLFIVYSDETSLKAILIDACSGTELKSVKTPPEPELANLKHIQLINDYVITVTSNKNNAVIKKWHWKEFFCNQLKKMQLEEWQSEKWQSEKWQVKGILLPSNFDFNNFDFDNFVLKEKSDINIDDDDADCFFLFWKDRKNNNETRCLVWMHGEIKNSGNNPTIKIKFDVDVDGILRLYDENKDEEFYTFLPLSSAIKDKNLPAEWVQSSCNYLKKRNLNNSLKEIIINSIRQYVDNNVFNGTTAIFDLIDSDASDVDIIIMAILSYKKYMPTGLYEKNPLTKAIEKENIVLVGKILEYCLHVHYFRNYEPGFMSMIVDALPSLANKYPEMLLKLLEQCTCLKVPSDWEIGFQGVYSTKIHKIRDLNRYTKQPASLTAENLYIDPYSATYCHVPLYNLCHQRDDPLYRLCQRDTRDTLPHFPHSPSFIPVLKFYFSILLYLSLPLLSILKKLKRSHSYDNLSPFAKLTFLRSSEVFQSTIFKTIVLRRIMTTTTVKSNPASSRKLMISSISFGVIWALFFIPRLLTNFFIFKFIKYKTKKAKKLFTTLIELAAFILPLTTGCLELSNKTVPPELRSLSILFLWILIFLQLRFTEKIGMFAAVFTNLFEQIMPLLIFLFFILFAYAHSLMVLLSETSPDNGVNTFTGFYQSIKNTWLILLNDYSSLEPWTKNYLLDILMITFSLSTAIILFNVLIALVSNAYEETLKNAHTIWVIELAEIIAEIELNPLISYYLPTLRAEVPWTIIYKASTEDVEKWATKHEEMKKKYQNINDRWTTKFDKDEMVKIK
ncbi:hypothetical protein RhiirA4_462789 [Rhizophagus irregularis]|uniref:Ion transport domain-containing protein n=1 Tax=Rhizophagus irregularis TaxID=588596 RepID=A0A2I1GLN8_9GLOM|nr:hypothetical protein RhiirA4_462789 [Rhizophagus irregularis]